jgi:6-bladed beta-propeller
MRRLLMGAGALLQIATLARPLAAQAPARWQLVEDLRIGGDQSDMTMFSEIRGVVAGPKGHIFVLDAKPQEIRIFDAAGKFVALAARKGSGPGEIAHANGLLVLNDVFWVNDPANARWSVYSVADGKSLRQVTIPITSYGYLWQAGVDPEGRILDPIYVPRDNAAAKSPASRSDPRLRRVRTDGTIVDTIPAPDCSLRNAPAKSTFVGTTPNRGNTMMQIPYLPRPLTAIDGRGAYWCAPNDEYLLLHRSLTKPDTLHSVRLRYTRIPVTPQERDSAIERAKTALSRYQQVDADYSLIPTTQPIFQRLDVDDRAQLWARKTTPSGTPPTFDVYDANGRLVATVTTALRFNSYLPIHFRGEYAYGVVQDADDVPYVVRARIVRPR